MLLAPAPAIVGRSDGRGAHHGRQNSDLGEDAGLVAGPARHRLPAARAHQLRFAVSPSRRPPGRPGRRDRRADPQPRPTARATVTGTRSKPCPSSASGPSDTVVEIWPGGGWYTEILAPYLASGGGRLYAVAPDWGLEGLAKLKAANPALYGSILTADFPAFEPTALRVPDGTADVVLTFRNVHNWRMGYRRGGKADYSPEAFRQMYAMLKPGGVLGIVDHRLPELASDERERTSGYIKLSTVRRLAEQAGFRLAGASEVNANPADTADWPDGVWTLPPSPGAEGKGPRPLPGDRRKRPDDVEVRQAALNAEVRWKNGGRGKD